VSKNSQRGNVFYHKVHQLKIRLECAALHTKRFYFGIQAKDFALARHETKNAPIAGAF